MHPIKGYCYNIDDLCEEEKCTCWENEEHLVAKIGEIKKQFPGWESVATKKMAPNIQFWTKGGLTNDEEDERDDLPEPK